ncbi:MAG: DUF493 domain-containing protein [Wenzhouxiangellaceae bacterium]|nr:DUF493 domain-containing protein [Wenzhouxiangellaceae bacterium]
MTEAQAPRLDADGTLAFPCRWPLKAMLQAEHDSADRRQAVLDVLHALEGAPDLGGVQQRASRNGRYASLTVEVQARSRDHLEQLYAAVRELDGVVMTL